MIAGALRWPWVRLAVVSGLILLAGCSLTTARRPAAPPTSVAPVAPLPPRPPGPPGVPADVLSIPDAVPRVEPLGPATLYHRGTVRGGQALQQLGNIVVVGDVNPGAELVASGDILVFGALRGTAHAGAQGDRKARVFALQLAPTQLRIAAYIAADESGRAPREPEVAFVKGEGIAIASYAKQGTHK